MTEHGQAYEDYIDRNGWASDIEHHHPEAHAVPMRVLLSVFAALLVLTFITVAVTWVDLGQFNLWAALGIAVVKAALVCLYFMHLRYDAPFNGIVLCIALMFVALFIGFALMDSLEYQPNFEEPAIVESASS